MKNSAYDIAVIGGGASGMMAAIAAKTRRPEKTVLLLERNGETGRKLLATGNGRCNFTNVSATPEDYGESTAFTSSVMERWGPEKVMELMAQMGVMHRVEEGGRVYPYSGRGASVTEALRRKLTRLGVAVRCNAEVKDVSLRTAGRCDADTKNANLEAAERCGAEMKNAGQEVGAAAPGRFRIELADGTQIFCETLILAVGGKAGGQYGCSGDGYRFARKLGHDVVKARPALAAVNCKEWNKQWKGVRSQAKVSLWRTSPEDGGVYRKVAEEAGEVQFTDFGLSGICVFDLSRHIVYTGNMKEGRREAYALAVDFLPDQSEERVRQMLVDRRKVLRGGTADELLLSVVHERIVVGLLSQAGIGISGGVTPAMAWPDAASVTDEQLARLAKLLKGWSFEVEGTKGFNDAQVTAGGVCLEQVDSQTMESKIQPGLYLCGEVLDVDGRCGGYNLQWAFASGYAAGYYAAGDCAVESHAAGDCAAEGCTAGSRASDGCGAGPRTMRSVR